MSTIKLRKGFDINLVGSAEKKLGDSPQPETFALKPTDFHGILRPKLLVQEGDSVKAGTPLLYDKQHENILYCAPVSGEVAEVVRGEKRRILEVRILADSQVTHEQFTKYSVSEITNMSRAEAQAQILKSGIWPNLIQRPYGIVANPEDTPKAIFISAFDSHPLAPDYGFLFKNDEKYFQAGIDVLRKFTPGVVHLNVKSTAEISHMFAHAKEVQLNKFSGPHPVGCVGVQIHHLDPINKGDVAWTINPVGVIQIGKLFTEGIYDASRVVAVTGSEVSEPQYYQTYTGASVNKFLENNLKSDHVRVISGNVLTGERIEKNGYVGFYDHQVTVIPEGDYYEMLGWFSVTPKKLSFQRTLGLWSFLQPNKEYTLDTNTRGEKRAFVQSGVLEKVIPMDLYPVHLIKAIMANDYDEMEALGIYEVIEEDLALCDFVDVSKHDIQKILREGLEMMQYS